MEKFSTHLALDNCVLLDKICSGGGDFRKLEPVIALKSLNFGRIDKIIRRLRLFYKENPASFDVPAFAVKVY